MFIIFHCFAYHNVTEYKHTSFPRCLQCFKDLHDTDPSLGAAFASISYFFFLVATVQLVRRLPGHADNHINSHYIVAVFHYKHTHTEVFYYQHPPYAVMVEL